MSAVLESIAALPIQFTARPDVVASLAHITKRYANGRIVCEGTPSEVKSLGAAISGASGTSASASTSSRTLKIIRCATALTATTILAVPGVTTAEPTGELTTITTTQPERTLREFLALDQTLTLGIAAIAFRKSEQNS